MQIIAYFEDNGNRTIPDYAMVEIYNRMKELGLIETVFFSQEIVDEQHFLRVMKNPSNIVNVVVEDKKVVAIFWLNDFYINSAFGHFCCFPEIWGKKTIQCLRNQFDYWFGFEREGEPILDVIIGKIPATNHRAIKFVEEGGMTILGTIPLIAHGSDKNKRVGDTIMYITREGRSWVT